MLFSHWITKKVVYLSEIVKALNYMSMMFIERIKQLREQCQIPQRQLAAAPEMDQVACCKTEKGERRAKREQVYLIAELLKVDNDDFSKIFQFFETLYINGRLQLPLKGIVLIGY
jgi:transcriptional regulator with XRE-family HTH domain